jgi:hypothetical protein
MSGQDRKGNPPAVPAEPDKEVPRSGAGAGSALSAMLRKRQMRAAGDAEPDPQAPDDEVRKTGSE